MTTTNHTSPRGEELKPCPFCGSAAEMQHSYQWWIQCSNEKCGATQAHAPMDRKGAADSWNRRVDASGEDAANGAIAALQRLESACDKIAALRTQEQYLSMIDGGQQDALLELDDARMAARAALTAEKVAAEPVAYADNLGSRSPGDVMMSAYALCPDSVAGQPARMRWIADYFLKNYAAPQQPAQSAEQIEQYVLSVLPSVYYMDPPDGGTVTVLEQLRRMADDAAKYRALLAASAGQAEPFEKIARAIHYPTCWDTAAYPTIESAIRETMAAHKIGCSECEHTEQTEAVRDDSLPQSAMPAWRDVVRERRRQIAEEGWTPEHDDKHTDGSLAVAGACYALVDARDTIGGAWPWDFRWWKPTTQRRNLIKAAALILAEIERIDRGNEKE